MLCFMLNVVCLVENTYSIALNVGGGFIGEFGESIMNRQNFTFQSFTIHVAS